MRRVIFCWDANGGLIRRRLTRWQSLRLFLHLTTLNQLRTELDGWGIIR